MSSRPILIALLLAAAAGAGADDGAPAPAAPAPAAPTQTTIVHGAPPDLTGRWLVLFDVAEKAVRRTVPSFLDIGLVDGKVQITERFVDLPPDQAKELDEHNQTQSQWEPTASDLAELAEQWNSLPEAERHVAQVTNDLWEQTAFTAAEKADPVIKDSVWVIRQTIGFEPGGQRPTTQVNVFGASARDGTGWNGAGVLAQVIAAPFPVPITFHGTFRMRRVDAAPSATGWLAHLADMFRGCGR